METRPEYSALNPFPWYRHMRENEPVVFNRRFFYWQVFRYEDVQRTLSDYSAFSSKFVGGSGKHPFGTSLITLDPPRHRQLRNLVTLAFTPRAVARLTARIEGIVEERLALPSPPVGWILLRI